jgi:GT2 family glycosyltransferase
VKDLLIVPAVDIYASAKQDLTNLLESIKAGATDQHMEIVVCLDSCSRIFEAEFKSLYPEFTFLNHTGNRKNFCGNSNVGLRIARERGVGALLVNMDTILPHYCFLKKMMGRGMVSASTMEFTEKDSLRDVIEQLSGMSDSFEEAFRPVQQIAGWKVAGYCVYYPGALLQKVGVLDENSFEASMDDDDMTARALLAGFTVEKSGVHCFHKGSHIDQLKTGKSLTGAYSNETLGLHLKKFYRKWSVPKSVPHAEAIKWVTENFKWSEEMYCE